MCGCQCHYLSVRKRASFIFIISLSLLFQAVFLHRNGEWEREIRQLFFESFRREELPSHLSLGSCSKTKCSVFLVHWLDGRHILPGFYWSGLRGDPFCGWQNMYCFLSLCSICNNFVRPSVGDEIWINLICLCACVCACTNGLHFWFGLSDTREIRTIEEHIKNYLPTCSSPLFFFSFYTHNEVYDNKLRLLPVCEVIIFLFAE